VTDLPQDPAEQRGRNLAVAIFTAATLAPAVVAIIVIAILNSASDDNAAANTYISRVAQHVYVIERDRQAFIDAGRDMCDTAGEHAAAATDGSSLTTA
jgi:hypothetical protein